MQSPESAVKTAELSAKFLAYSNMLEAAIFSRDEVAIATARQNLLFAFEETLDNRIATSRAILDGALSTKRSKT